MSTHEFTLNDLYDLDYDERQRGLIGLWLIRSYDVNVHIPNMENYDDASLVAISEATNSEGQIWQQLYEDVPTRLLGALEIFNLLYMGAVDMRVVPFQVVYSVGAYIVGVARPHYGLLNHFDETGEL